MKKSLVKVFAVLHGLGCYLGSTVSYHDDDDDEDDISERLSYHGRHGYGFYVFCGTRRRHRKPNFSYTNSTDIEEEDLDDEDEATCSPSFDRNRYNNQDCTRTEYLSRTGRKLESPGPSVRGRHNNSKEDQHSPFQKRGCGHVNSHVTGMPEVNPGVILISMRRETNILTNGQESLSVSPRPVIRLDNHSNSVHSVSSGYHSEEETQLEHTLGTFTKFLCGMLWNIWLQTLSVLDCG